MEVLIHTIPADAHAAGVQVALNSLGVNCQTWYTGDFPSDQTISVRLGSDNKNYKVDDLSDHIDFPKHQYDVVWHRRLPASQAADSLIEECDREFVSREINHFLKNVIPLVGKDAFWVNGYAESVYADRKFVQLEMALKVGLRIPETLASNSPSEIRSFIKDSGSAVIYKPMRGFNWREPGRQLITYTRVVTENDLPNDHLLKLCPGIFQHYIPKAFEVRATFMGNHCFAVALHSEDKEDWRVSSEKRELRAEAYNLPVKVHEKCLALMKSLKIVFGCIDIVVTPEGNHVFLEVNEAGQFLWVEQMVPMYPMLDAFAEFLISKNSNFTYSQRSTPLRWQNVARSKEYSELLRIGDTHSHKTTA